MQQLAEPSDATIVGRHQAGRRPLPLRVGTRGSPLALVQTRHFQDVLTRFCPVLRGMDVFEEHVIETTGDKVQDRLLSEIGGKGLFAKEIHEALAERRIDFAVHSLKDLETEMPEGIVLACALKREDPRDALIFGAGVVDPGESADVYAALPQGALVATASVRRQAQLLHARPDLRMTIIRGNVQTRLRKLAEGAGAATMLALAGLRRLGMEHLASRPLDVEVMVPAACQGIVGITVRADDVELRQLLSAIEDPEARAVAQAERAMLAVLDGSCHTPIGGYARMQDGLLVLSGLVARGDGTFLLRRSLSGAPDDAERIGRALGAELRADSPADVFG